MNHTFPIHFFLDESGDTTFFGSQKCNIIGQNGITLSFSLGMAKFQEPLQPIRNHIISLQNQVVADPYYKNIPSIRKKCQAKNGYYFHATNDLPEVRKLFFDYIQTLDFIFEMVVARKIPSLYIQQHNSNPDEFYADLLSHLLKKHLTKPNRLVLNVAERGKTTKNRTFKVAKDKALEKFTETQEKNKAIAEIVFNVQNQHSEPLLNIVDYLCWSVQRVFEKGETRYYDFIQNKISLVIDLYDLEKYKKAQNYYTRNNLLTKNNKLSPPVN